MAMRTLLGDPMLRLLVVATLLAAFLPATGDGQHAARILSNCGIFLIFLLNGMKIARGDILAGIANLRFIFPLVLWVFGAMAMTGLGLSYAGKGYLPPLLAAGFLYLGTLPTTIQSSTSYSSLAGGNVALSVIASALLSIVGVFATVPIFLLLGGTGEGDVGAQAIVKIVLLLIVPFVMGQMVQLRTQGFVREHRRTIIWSDRLVIALAVYVAISGAVEQGLWSRIDLAGWLMLGAMVGAFLIVAHGGAWGVSDLLGLPRPDRIAFLFAGAQKSAAIGAPLATVLFPPSVAGFIVVPLLLYHLLQLVLAAPLASLLADRNRSDDGCCSAPTTRN